MKWWPFRKQGTHRPPERTVVPFSSDIEELPVLKRHALRALCAMLLDRHTACRSHHPFCGNITDGVPPIQLIAHSILQVGEDDGGFLIAIYLSRAQAEDVPEDSAGLVDPMGYTANLKYADKTPFRKLVVQQTSDGTYVVQYGPILNPVEGDYSTGRIDQDNVRWLYWCDPEPAHTRWQYWESQLSAEQQVVPEFKCLMLRGEWWVVDSDRAKGLAQQVAALTVADNPNHNFRDA